MSKQKGGKKQPKAASSPKDDAEQTPRDDVTQTPRDDTPRGSTTASASGSSGSSVSNDQTVIEDVQSESNGSFIVHDTIKDALFEFFNTAANKSLLKDHSKVNDVVEALTHGLTDAVAKRLKDTCQFEVNIIEDYKKQQQAFCEYQLQRQLQIMQKLDTLEQHGRLNNVRVFGIDELENESTTQLVVSEINKRLQMKLSVKDVSISHRLGFKRLLQQTMPRFNKRTNQMEERPSAPRPIIVNFVNRSVRNEVLKKRSQLKGTGISIGVDLTKPRADLLRKLQTEHQRSAWADFNGRIMLKRDPNQRRPVEVKPTEFPDGASFGGETMT